MGIAPRPPFAPRALGYNRHRNQDDPGWRAGTASEDALHISVATVHGVDYLLTWDCKHIANAMMRQAIERVCREGGYEPPVICTPEELMDNE